MKLLLLLSIFILNGIFIFPQSTFAQWDGLRDTFFPQPPAQPNADSLRKDLFGVAYAPVNCRDFVNSVLKTHHMGEIGHPDFSIKSSRYSEVGNHRLPIVDVTMENPKTGTPKRVSSTLTEDNFSVTFENNWEEVSTRRRTAYKARKGKEYKTRDGHYLKEYTFAPDGDKCPLKRIRISFTPTGQIFTQVAELDFVKCFRLRKELVSPNVNEGSISTEAELYGDECSSLIGSFKEFSNYTEAPKAAKSGVGGGKADHRRSRGSAR